MSTTDATKIKPTTQGILVCAIGHPYYAHMAFNLAVSLKFNSPHLPIAILHDGSSLSAIKDYVSIFDKVIQLKPEHLAGVHGKDNFKFKLHLDELTPFDRTLFLDVDMIWNPTKTPDSLFKELKGTQFTISNRGTTSENLTSGWAKITDITNHYGIDRIHDIASEFIYFEGKPTVFAKAREVYNDNAIEVKDFGEGKPDEVYLSIAMALTKTKPHQTPWHPTYWQGFHFKKVWNQKYIQSHYATSTGGAFVQHNIKKIYDNLITHYSNRMGVTKPLYQLMPKSKFIKGRKAI